MTDNAPAPIPEKAKQSLLDYFKSELDRITSESLPASVKTRDSIHQALAQAEGQIAHLSSVAHYLKAQIDHHGKTAEPEASE